MKPVKISNSRLNLTLTVGTASQISTSIEFKIINSSVKTDQLTKEIKTATKEDVNIEQVWIYADGQKASSLGESMASLQFLGKPKTYDAPTGNGAWCLIDVKELRSMGLPIPDINDKINDLIKDPLPGDSHIEIKITSGSTLIDGMQLQKNYGYFLLAALFDSFSLNLNVLGDESTVTNGLQLISPIIGNAAQSGFMTLFGALNDANINICFASWENLNPDAKEMLKIEAGLPQEVGGLVSAIGDLFERHVRIVLIINTSTHIEIKMSIPGLLKYAMNAMD